MAERLLLWLRSRRLLLWSGDGWALLARHLIRGGILLFLLGWSGRRRRLLEAARLLGLSLLRRTAGRSRRRRHRLRQQLLLLLLRIGVGVGLVLLLLLRPLGSIAGLHWRRLLWWHHRWILLLLLLLRHRRRRLLLLLRELLSLRLRELLLRLLAIGPLLLGCWLKSNTRDSKAF